MQWAVDCGGRRVTCARSLRRHPAAAVARRSHAEPLSTGRPRDSPGPSLGLHPRTLALAHVRTLLLLLLLLLALGRSAGRDSPRMNAILLRNNSLSSRRIQMNFD